MTDDSDDIAVRVRSAYDQVAANYVKQNAAMPPELIDLGRKFLRVIPTGARILDLGCGTGRDMAWLASQGLVVVGADLSAGMLYQARARTSGQLVQMDMRQLALRDHCMDGIWCMASLLHLPKWVVPPTIAEMARVLTPGGALALALQGGEGEQWEVGAYGYPVRRFFARYSSEEVKTLLESAGFAVIEGDSDGPAARRSGRIWLRFLCKRPLSSDCN